MNSTLTCSLAQSRVSGRTLGKLALIAALGLLAPKAPAADPRSHLDFRQVEHAGAAIGTMVKDSDGNVLGRVDDLSLDLENRCVAEVIVSSGGFLGFGVRTVGVPPGALTFDSADEMFLINVDQKKFKAAPALSMSKWTEHRESQRMAAEYRFYGQEPYFNDAQPIGHIRCSKNLMNLPVKNLQEEELGNVSSFVCDNPLRSILNVVIIGPGLRHTQSLVPASALRFNETGDALYLDASKQAFVNQPRFKWVAGVGGDYQQEAYMNTRVATNNGVNTRQNVDEGSAASYTPLRQGTSFEDVDTTYRIYAAMRLDTTLSENAQNVEVGTRNGRVTLRGHVDREQGKAKIDAIAASVARPENVSNLLEVRPIAAAK